MDLKQISEHFKTLNLHELLDMDGTMSDFIYNKFKELDLLEIYDSSMINDELIKALEEYLTLVDKLKNPLTIKYENAQYLIYMLKMLNDEIDLALNDGRENN